MKVYCAKEIEDRGFVYSCDRKLGHKGPWHRERLDVGVGSKRSRVVVWWRRDK